MRGNSLGGYGGNGMSGGYTGLGLSGMALSGENYGEFPPVRVRNTGVGAYRYSGLMGGEGVTQGLTEGNYHTPQAEKMTGY